MEYSNIIEFSKKTDIEVTTILREIGVPANLRGYSYVRKAILMTVDDISMIGAVTKILYPDIAKDYHTTPLCVEHAIRRAIEVAWKRGDGSVLKKYFGNSAVINNRKPTNSEFIATIADLLRLSDISA